ncbi:MAG: hypothetical protein ACRDYF_16515 [Acidimicrobiia bacterium]
MTVSKDDIAAAMFAGEGAEERRVADKLGVDPTDLEISQAAGHDPWCLTVHVRRLGRERRVSFQVEANGQLKKIASCA